MSRPLCQAVCSIHSSPTSLDHSFHYCLWSIGALTSQEVCRIRTYDGTIWNFSFYCSGMVRKTKWFVLLLKMMKHFFKWGILITSFYYDYFQKKLEYHLWMHKWCFYSQETIYSLKPGVPAALQASAASSFRPPCPRTFSKLSAVEHRLSSLLSVTVHANQQPAKHLCLHFERDTLGGALFQLILYAFQLCIAISQKVTKIKWEVVASATPPSVRARKTWEEDGLSDVCKE